MESQKLTENIFKNIDDVKLLWSMDQKELKIAMLKSKHLPIEKKTELLKPFLKKKHLLSSILSSLNVYHAMYLAKQIGAEELIFENYLMYKVTNDSVSFFMHFFNEDLLNCIDEIYNIKNNKRKKFLLFLNKFSDEIQIKLINKVKNDDFLNFIYKNKPHLLKSHNVRATSLKGKNLYRFLVYQIGRIVLLPKLDRGIERININYIVSLYKHHRVSFFSSFNLLDINKKEAVILKLATSNYLGYAVRLYNLCSKEEKTIILKQGFVIYYNDTIFDRKNLNNDEWRHLVNFCPLDNISKLFKLLPKDIIFDLLRCATVHNLDEWLSNYTVDELVTLSLKDKELLYKLIKYFNSNEYFSRIMKALNFDIKLFINCRQLEEKIIKYLNIDEILAIVRNMNNSNYSSILTAKILNLILQTSLPLAMQIYEVYADKVELILEAKISDTIIENFGIGYLSELVKGECLRRKRELIEQLSLKNAFDLLCTMGITPDDEIFNFMKINRKQALLRRIAK